MCLRIKRRSNGKSEEIARLVRDAGGGQRGADTTEAGFLPGSISHALKSGVIDKLTRGVYCLPEVFDDEFAAVTYRWRKCVLSHGSALYLAGLSDRMPGALDVTVPHGYNPRDFPADPDVRIHRVNKDIYELGIIEAKSPGGAMVRAYCAERAVADSSPRGLPAEPTRSSSTTRSRAISRSDADLESLARMCTALGVEEEFRMYLEVLK